MQILAKNKRAFFDYEILKKWECGVVFLGKEVKAVQAGQANLRGSYVTVQRNEIWIKGMHIAPYKPGSSNKSSAPPDHEDPDRMRKLLLRKNEIAELTGLLTQKGVTIIPLELFRKRGLMKLLIGEGRGKKQYDKRSTMKKRIADREIDRQKKTFSRK